MQNVGCAEQFGLKEKRMGKVKYDFSGEVALLTGAGAGMGWGAAKAFAEAGAKVVLGDVNQALLDKAVEELRSKGGEATGFICDVSDDAQVRELVEKTVATYGRLDCAFNNAGIITHARDIADMDVAEYDRVMNINLRGVWSAIVNNSSLAGKIGVAQRAQYVAAKHGMLGMTKSVALEVGGDGIRVNAICPGTIDTPMVRHMTETNDLNIEMSKAAVPLKRLGTIEEVAHAVLWLCSDASSYVIGESLSVDAGVTIQ
jgi:NAD(P)-dependent dehydrogenase (short-subunit alcohol dehydrogenase family)